MNYKRNKKNKRLIAHIIATYLIDTKAFRTSPSRTSVSTFQISGIVVHADNCKIALRCRYPTLASKLPLNYSKRSSRCCRDVPVLEWKRSSDKSLLNSANRNRNRAMKSMVRPESSLEVQCLESRWGFVVWCRLYCDFFALTPPANIFAVNSVN